ncbi:Uncharacterised protein [Mycobacterium tuberculosis]|nr:Uncharacterised protein [Mycobacterium tuberculosis]
MIIGWAPTSRAARSTWASVASGRPYAMASRTVPAKTYCSCVTMPSRLR